MPRPKLIYPRSAPPAQLLGSMREQVERQARAVFKPAGWPTDIITADAGLNFGDLARVDPSAGAIELKLPSIDAPEKLGGFVTVANVSASTNDIVIRPSDADATISSAVRATMAWAYGPPVMFVAMDITSAGRLWIPFGVEMGVL